MSFIKSLQVLRKDRTKQKPELWLQKLQKHVQEIENYGPILQQKSTNNALQRQMYV